MEIVNLYNLDTNGIQDRNDGYKQEYQKENLFLFYYNALNFFLKTEIKSICYLYNNNEEKEYIYSCLISINKDINKDEIEFNSLLEIILNFKKTTFSAYEKFCYNMNRKIKLNEMFKRCKTNIVT